MASTGGAGPSSTGQEEDEEALLRRLASLPDSLKRAILGAREQAATEGLVAPEQASAPAAPAVPPQQPPTSLPPPFALRRGGAAVVDDAFGSASDLRAAALEARALLDQRARPAAMGGGGRGGQAATSNKWRAKNIRGDEAMFLSPSDAAAAGPALGALARRLVASLGPRLRAQGCWPDLLPGGRVELQLARYQRGWSEAGGGGGGGDGGGDGSSAPPPPPRYARHADNGGATGAARRVTAVLYLGDGRNEGAGWDVARDGGDLALYLPADAGGVAYCLSAAAAADAAPPPPPQPALRVAPLPGRLVIFDSVVEHEVLPVTAPAGSARVALTAWFHGGGGGDQARLPSPPRPLPPPSALLPQQQPSLADDLAAPILVTIASYCDPETFWTIRDVFQKAADPGRVRCAVVWQGGEREEEAAAGPSPPRWRPPRSQMRELFLPAREACGPCVARHLALAALWRGEPLVLQIDSHTRLRQGWDGALVLMLRAAERAAAAGGPSLSRGAVLSTYPPPYEGAGASARVPDLGGAAFEPPDGGGGGGGGGNGAAQQQQEQEQDVTVLCASADAFNAHDGLPRFRCRRVRPSHVPRLALGRGADPDDARLFNPGVLPGAGMWAAGFSFARASAVVRGPAAAPPCCPRMRHLFFGEEAYGLARLYTGGYDVFVPARCVAWHQWGLPRSERAKAAAAGVAEATEAEATVITYAALVAGDARARHERAASERCVRALLAGEEVVVVGGRGGSGAAVATLWWGGGGDDDRNDDADDDPADWRPGGRWGLGTARPIESLYARCGVDFRARHASAWARRGGLPAGSFEHEEGEDEEE